MSEQPVFPAVLRRALDKFGMTPYRLAGSNPNRG